MDKPISVGDLVQIVRARECCPQHTAWGLVYRVVRMETGYFRCSYCNKPHGMEMTVVWGDGSGDRMVGGNLPRLKRIPPLDELDDVKQDEEITA